MIKDRIDINKDNYYEILKLVTAEDDGSVNVALSILEQSNIKKSRIYIYLLLKEITKAFKLNKDEYPKLYGLLYTDSDNDRIVLSYKFLYNICKNDEEKEFILEQFKNNLVEFLSTYGFEFLKDCELKITKKNITINE
tara:strand:+ start:2103 stop:2516 length:414 start_codon:yes stop_codon:yes gene_type:complete